MACAMLLPGVVCAAENPEPRPWNLSLRAFASRDSNVPLAATDTVFTGERSSNVFGVGLSGDYRLYRGGRWTVAATGAVQQTYNGDSSLKEFNLTSASPGLLARYAFRALGRPARLTMSYAARRDWLGGSGFAAGHAATLDAGMRPSRSTEVGAFVAAGTNDFDDDGPNPDLSSRDGASYRAGLRGTMGFNRNRQAIRASLAYVKNDAKGANFVFSGPAASLQLMSYVAGPWALAASASYAKADYTNFAVEPRRESRTKDYRLALYGPLTRKLSADLSVGRSYYDSNQSVFEAKRKNVSLGVAYLY